MTEKAKTPLEDAHQPQPEREGPPSAPNGKKKEIGGRKGPEPTRYGDWESKGIAHDF
ncbi:MAG: succinate dehydrogenase assembly factor 4 [Pacificimonas sp.]